jgi:beta-galactosidase
MSTRCDPAISISISGRIPQISAYAAGTLTSQESGVTLALEAQFCAAFNRHVMDNYAGWTVVPDYYQSAPANYYAAFWHAHSVGGLSYGFAYDDVNNQSSSIVGAHPEHMAFGISY